MSLIRLDSGWPGFLEVMGSQALVHGFRFMDIKSNQIQSIRNGNGNDLKNFLKNCSNSFYYLNRRWRVLSHGQSKIVN